MDWNKRGRSGQNFGDAIKALKGLNKYQYIVDDGVDLYKEMRCGLTHALAPTGIITLSHGDREEKTTYVKGAKLNFNIDELYTDFKIACEDVIGRNYSEPNKMNRSKIAINLKMTFPSVK